MENNRYDAIIIGAGLTGLSLALKLDKLGMNCAVLEKSERVGGLIRTIHDKGYTFEVGPNTGVVATQEVSELFNLLGSSATLEIANSAAKSRWIFKDKSFHPLPSSLPSAIATPLFTWFDKFRILGEPFRKKGTNPNESIGTLVERRMGRSFLDYAVDPFLGGVYAGDPFQLVTRYALPKLYNLEQEYGSFTNGMIQKARAPKESKKNKPSNQVFSVSGGLESMVKAIYAEIASKQSFHFGIKALQIAHNETTQDTVAPSWHVAVTTSQGTTEQLSAKYVISTIRGDLLQEVLDPTMLSQIPTVLATKYAPVTEVVVGFDHLPNVKRNAFGGLVPSCEKRNILGILYPSSCFAKRTPYEDSALFTIFMEGLRDAERFKDATEENLTKTALDELYQMMGIDRAITPNLLYTKRYQKAIPQYDASTEQRLKEIAQFEQNYKGLLLAGSIRNGIGMANRIAQGFTLAQHIFEETKNN